MSARHAGLTWDHPRGYDALAAAATSVAPAGLLHWDKQPLEGFESHPIADLAARYDLLVLDHPHIGEAVAHDCLVPLEALFSADEIADWSRASIGSAMSSYRWQGKHWALPLDVATQVSAFRPDLVALPPASWEAVARLSETRPVALSIAGPHAALNLYSIALALGGEVGGDRFLDDAVAAEALSILAVLFHRTPTFTRLLNPIGLLQAMAAHQPLAYVPLVYGYVNYASPAAHRQPVGFADAPAGPTGIRGSILGGTGIALTRRSRPDDELLDHLRWLMSSAAQTDFIPTHHGQPSARSAWQSPAVNALSGGFYTATQETTEAAWVRPRFDGYIAFQTAAASIIRAGLEARDSGPAILSRLREAWTLARRTARGPLD